MRNYQIIIMLFLSIFMFSCKGKPERTQISENYEPEFNIKELESDFMKWWTYHSYNISLSSNFSGLNEKSEGIDKEEFLNALTSGNFIPVKLKSKDGANLYKLYKLDALAAKGIGSTIKNESLTILKYFKMEGTNFPSFDLTDLNDNHYTNENTKGKTIVFKTWFIRCQACVAEFPELNKLAEKYKNRNDIIFLSLALDSKAELDKFLQSKVFKYNVVPDQEKLINKTLSLQLYPTHVIVDKNGMILKVVNKASEMISFFENERQLTEKTPPPPPHP